MEVGRIQAGRRPKGGDDGECLGLDDQNAGFDALATGHAMRQFLVL